MVGLTLDICGASSFMWKQQHVIGHHVYTNVKSEDPDVCLVTARLAPWQPHAAHHTLQHIYLAALYSALALKTILVSDFVAYGTGTIGPVQLGKMQDHEVAVMYAGKIFFACWYVAAPLLWSSWSLLELAGLWAVAQVVTGWTLALMFQVRCAPHMPGFNICTRAPVIRYDIQLNIRLSTACRAPKGVLIAM